MTKHRYPERQTLPGVFMAHVALLAATALPLAALALPEDATQEIVIEAGSSELYLDRGLLIYRGSAGTPARITQGTMVITGEEIRIERDGERSLKKVTATGKPARFQQQPALDQEVLHVSGETLSFDNVEQTLSVDVQAEFTQADTTLTGHHIDYDLESRSAATTGRSPEEQVRMTIQATGD
jgi:lipopolysaccharide export system protein LptA